MNDMSLKAKVNNIAKENNIAPQAVLQNYLMNRFLYRLSLTEHKKNFVIKGGMLISSIIGIGHRSTMDLDSILRNIPLTPDAIREAFESICKIETDDGIEFVFGSLDNIRKDDEYGGYRVAFTALFGKIKAPMSMDISTGDVITPGAKLHSFSDMLDSSKTFELWSYPVETVLAEKIEAILSRGTENTRPRDFYDVYMLYHNGFDQVTFNSAFELTAKHRGTFDRISNYKEILDNIRISSEMSNRWNIYVRTMPYAKGIELEDSLDIVNAMLSLKK